jgi:hypothetical protein
MVMEVSTSTQVNFKEEDRGLVILFSALKKVPIFPKHDIKSMVQHVGFQLVLTMRGILIIISTKTRVHPQVPKHSNLGRGLVTSHCDMHFMLLQAIYNMYHTTNIF